jgi:hypothetical protein
LPNVVCLAYGLWLGLDHRERRFHAVAADLAAFAPLA